MGWIGRSIGDFGSQVGGGYDINLGWKERLQNMAMQQARQKIADMQASLQLQEFQQRIKQMSAPQFQGTAKTPGLEPKFPNLQAAAAYYLQKGDFEKLKLVNDEIEKTKPQKVETGYTEMRPDTSGKMWGVNKATGTFEQVPSSGKFPIPHEGQGAGAPGDVDALAYDIAAGRGTMPTGKFGAAVANRMKQLGLEVPVKNQQEVMKAAGAAQKAMAARQSVDRIMKNPNLTPSDALNIAGIYDRLKGTHIAADWKTRLDSTFSFRPSKKEIAELAEEIKNSTEDVRQQAIDAYKYAGMPVPPALTAGDLSDLGANPIK